MKDIIHKFLIKIKKKEDNKLYYLYNGSIVNKELTFNEQANEFDKSRKKMNIIVSDNDQSQSKQSTKTIISKDVICPDCKEDILIDIQNFKINLHDCKNKHTKLNILINKYEETQKIDLNKIICEVCNRNNKGNTHNNDFYICNTCNKSICPLCRSVHDKKHKIIDYDDKNYICKKHNDSFTKYCKTCNENICIICENKHNGHNILDFKNLIIDEEDLLEVRDELKNVINKFKWKINIIKELFDKMVNLIDIYYKINDKIIDNYNINQNDEYYRHIIEFDPINYLKPDSRE